MLQAPVRRQSPVAHVRTVRGCGAALVVAQESDSTNNKSCVSGFFGSLRLCKQDQTIHTGSFGQVAKFSLVIYKNKIITKGAPASNTSKSHRVVLYHEQLLPKCNHGIRSFSIIYNTKKTRIRNEKKKRINLTRLETDRFSSI